MRFLLGLALGAAMILAVVHNGRSTDLDWQGWLSGARHTMQAWLARAEVKDATPAPTADRGSDPAASPEAPAGEPGVAPATALSPGNEAAVIPIAPLPDQLAVQQPSRPSPHSEAAADADAAAAAEGADVATANAGAQAGEQTVWAPFHSEMSARGFAQRLSQALHHPFRVERRGPGRYQVVFGYGDDAERQTLLDRAAELTGLPL